MWSYSRSPRLFEAVFRDGLDWVQTCGPTASRPGGVSGFRRVWYLGQFREFESLRVHTRVNSWGLSLVHKLIAEGARA